jgi:hypothetical protein
MKKIFGIFVCMLLIATTLPVMAKISEPVVSNNEDLMTYSAEIKSEVRVAEPNPQSSINVYTNKVVYHKFEPIDITFLNNGYDSVSIGGPPVFRIWRFSFMGGKYVYPDWTHLMLIFIQPGGTWTEQWDQKTSYGVQVPWGIYRVEVPYYDYFTNSAENATDVFIILP